MPWRTSFFIINSFSWIGTPCFRGYGRRNGERRRKSVRGCIVSPDLSVLNLVIVKKGENDLPGLTDIEKPRMRGPKRASKIRKLFNLSKEDDVRKYVNTYRRTFTTKAGKIPVTYMLCLIFNYYVSKIEKRIIVMSKANPFPTINLLTTKSPFANLCCLLPIFYCDTVPIAVFDLC